MTEFNSYFEWRLKRTSRKMLQSQLKKEQYIQKIQILALLEKLQSNG